ncbi:MAG: molecular chaperone DnaK, partial [Candidatus Omnitrophica bacterium]|nr:molecular chaperone DnaK [Candidatus Omnitrophota bacterium]
IPPAPRGIPQIEVTFDIDANGIVHVSAKDLGTGKEQSIKITAPKKLSKEEIDKMVKDADKFAAEDAKRKEEVEAVNQADQLVYATEKSLKEFGDKVSQAERADIESRLNDLKSAIKDKNIDRIKRGMEELTKASHKLAEEIYKQTSAKQQQAQGGPQAGPQQQGPQKGESPKGGKEDIVDADYTVEDEDKNK